MTASISSRVSLLLDGPPLDRVEAGLLQAQEERVLTWQDQPG